jgi:2-polyprenyl-6-methoxyphenol hydroxylase-like FAD-dependent oxidoreductase
MRANRFFNPAGASAAPRRHHAVVVGGSLAGTLAARVLSDHFDRVTVLERDRFTEISARKGLPQGRHSHILLERGRRSLERFFPGLTAGLVRAGAELLDATRDAAWMGPYGWYVRFPGELQMLACTRGLIDRGVYNRVAALPNVRVRQRADVAGLIRKVGDEPGVAGVRLRSCTAEAEVDYSGGELAADLVVVADGRNSRLPAWLGALGHEPPEETVVNSFQGYASRYYRPPAGFEADWKTLYIQQAPPEHPGGGIVTPVEGGRWLVSLIGGDGDYPPTDEAGFLAFARGLRSPALYKAIAEAEPLSPIVSQRATENRLRHYERQGQFPDGLVALGDAVCAFNPVYGQGMTAAALGAEALDHWLREEWSHRGLGRSQVFQRHLARATSVAWQLSTGADYRFRTTEGPPPGTAGRLTGRYVAEVMRAATRRPEVRRRLTEVFHLLRPPSALFGPGILAGMVWDRVGGRTEPGPQRFASPRQEAARVPRRPHRSAAEVDAQIAKDVRG